jgi:homogentisate 1,2-dioxygenase
MQSLNYQTGIGNLLASEALQGSLPQGRNSPQRCAHGLYAELISGTAFTAPRAENLRSWTYRRLPSVAVGAFSAYQQPLWCPEEAPPLWTPAPLRWHALPIDAGERDFVDGLVRYASAGDPDAHSGMAALLYTATASMTRRALLNADAEMLLVPQQGSLRIQTEFGWLAVEPGEIALVPRGIAFRVEVDGPSRGYVCENYGAALRLPELGPIGSNGLANARDFLAPVASFDAIETGAWQLLRKQAGRLWQSTQAHSPFNVTAWHGTLYPVKYDTRRFNTIGTISFDHPDPSIFTVLTSPSDTPGWANIDFVIFPPRWMVAEDTFRPPWYHRNVMSEFMGLVLGQYDAKPEGFKPGGASLHNAFVPHGPDVDAFDGASKAELKPHKLDNTLAFMFETRWRLQPSHFAIAGGLLDSAYADCWSRLQPATP